MLEMLMTRLACALVLVGLFALPLAGQQPPARIDVARLGPQVGQMAPDFRLSDHQGKAWTREAIMGPNGAMLIFSRSADW